ncbi:MAG: hypothetical protein Q7S15_02580 [bacterium]|nr:hypothetical protein [bacterium]
MSRIIYDGDKFSKEQIDELEKKLDQSKIHALQLVMKALYELSEELGHGVEVIMRRHKGHGVGLWFPHLRRPPASPAKRKGKK